MIKTIYFVFFICAFSLGLWACTGKDSDKFKNLSSDQFEEMIQDKTIQLVDVRTVAEYSEGHIPGSININVLDNEFGTNIEELLQKDRPVAVYCKSGRRSRNAANILVKKRWLDLFSVTLFLFPLFFIATAIYNFHKTSITQVSAPTISSKHIFHLFSFKFFIMA